MTPRLIRLLASALLLCTAQFVQALITCTPPVAGAILTAYSGATGSITNITQGSVSFSCTRNLAADPLQLLLRANNGSNFTGSQNRVRRGATADRLNYEAYNDSACQAGIVWTQPQNASSLPITLQAAPAVPLGVAQNVTLNFWVCLPAGQTAVVTGATPYTDTVTMQIRNVGGPTVYNTGLLNISVTAIGICSITTLPNISISYTAFSGNATASSAFTLDCTSRLPYEMSLDAYEVVLANGIHYSIDINSATPPVTARGTGPGQNHTINVTVPGNQAGTCTTGICSSSHTHTLTITY